MEYITHQDELDDGVDVSTMDDPEEDMTPIVDDDDTDEEDESETGIKSDEM